jgi:hypothetical protein
MVSKFVVNGALAFVWVAVGIACTMYFEGLHFVTAAYVVVQIITTIGYGDISVNPGMHAFMTIYVLFGLCVAANGVNDVFTAMLEKSQEKLTLRMNELQKSVQSKGKKEHRISGSHHELYDFLAGLGIFTVFVLGGALFYVLVEDCTCSYGVSAAGCDDAGVCCVEDTCSAATGGYTKDFPKAIYMAVITLTTVGFGDFTPRSQAGRIFGFFWMIAGVLSFANFVTAFGTWIGAAFKKDHSSKFGRKIFNTIDKDGNGYLTRGEFMSWMLVKEGIVSSEQIDHFYNLFDALAAEDGEMTPGGLPKLGFSTLDSYFHEEGDTSDEESGDLLDN